MNTLFRPLAWLAPVAACLAGPGSSLADDLDAKELVASMERDHLALRIAVPAISGVDEAIRTECSEKHEGELATGEFCSCAAAVTVTLWRSDIDPEMRPRLEKYLENPSDEAATELLKYQGPELYGPLCRKALEQRP